MLRSFLIITFRILWRNKVTSFVNIFSLSVGITAFILMSLYVHHETSYDKFNEKYDGIYRLEADDYARLPPVVGEHIKERLPEVREIALLADGGKQFITYSPDKDSENVKQTEINFFWASPSTFNIFTLPFLVGDAKTALAEPMTMVLTESTSKKLFGDRNPVDQIIDYKNYQFRITGIIRDVRNSHLEIDALFSEASVKRIYPNIEQGINQIHHWGWIWSGTYLLMDEGVDVNAVEKKINEVLEPINDGIFISHKFDQFYIRPLSDMYFGGNLLNLPYGIHGNFQLIQILVAIGFFLLVLAVVNYINLSTARSMLRGKEVAVKRITGSTVSQLRELNSPVGKVIHTVPAGSLWTEIVGVVKDFHVRSLHDKVEPIW